MSSSIIISWNNKEFKDNGDNVVTRLLVGLADCPKQVSSSLASTTSYDEQFTPPIFSASGPTMMDVAALGVG